MNNFISRHLYKFIYSLVLLAIVCSVAIYNLSVSSDIDKYPEPKIITAEGIVKNVYTKTNDCTRFTLECQNKGIADELLFVDLSHGESLNLSPGDYIRLNGSCSAPDTPLNPGAFDYGDYIKSKGASLIMESDISRVHSHLKGMWHGVYSVRQTISDKILLQFHIAEAGLINAVVTGNKELISDEYSEIYRKSGIYHIVAVSGMHLNVFILLLSFLYTRLSISSKKKKITALIVTIGSCVFMFVFTGLGISVKRAAIMAFFACATGLFHREYSPHISLLGAFCLILLFEPYAVYDASFCLSFSATLGILLGVQLAEKINFGRFSPVLKSIVISTCVNLLTLPFTAYFFGAVSLVSVLSNLVILPLVPFLLVFSYMYAAVCISLGEFVTKIFAHLASPVAYCVNFIARLMASIPFSYVSISTAAVALAAFYLGMAIIFLKAKKRYIRISITSIIIIANVFVLSYNILVPSSRVTFLNALQGDCAVVHTSDGSAIMIDCGTESMENYAASQVIPFLNKMNIRKLDMLIITHFHDDHANGVRELIEAGYVKRLVVPDRSLFEDEEGSAKEIYDCAVRCHVPVTRVKKGDSLCAGEHRFEILSPDNITYPSANDASMVVRYKFLDCSVLFCADIESAGQYSLIPNLEECDIIKVAHHGAYALLSHTFADKVDADYAVISLKKDNKFQHPSPDTLKAYEKSEILRTDTEGYAISFEIKQNKIRRIRYAQHKR